MHVDPMVGIRALELKRIMVCTVRRLRILQKGFRLYSTGAKNTYNGIPLI